MDLLELVAADDGVVVSVTRHRGGGRQSGIEMDFEVFYTCIASTRESSRV
jgi:hypothetical protein